MARVADPRQRGGTAGILATIDALFLGTDIATTDTGWRNRVTSNEGKEVLRLYDALETAYFTAQTVYALKNGLSSLTDALARWKNTTRSADEIAAIEGNVGKIVGVSKSENVAKYSLSIIEKETGFVDLLPNLLKKEGLTMDDFRMLSQKRAEVLTNSEKLKLDNIRNALPTPNENTLIQKVIPKSDLEKWLDGTYNQVRGSVTRATDAKHLKTYDDLYYGERLDYSGSEFTKNIEECYVIRFKSAETSSAQLPTSSEFAQYEYPFTAHGFTSGNNGRFGVPEWNFKNGVNIEDGAEMYKITNNGTEVLEAVYNLKEKKFIKPK